MIKVLNLYSGIGGNRKLWKDVEVTAVEHDPKILGIYQELFPNDVGVCTDAHQYLLDHYEEFDFIWSSPPCPSHSDIRRMGVDIGRIKAIYPNMCLYEEIIFLKHFFKGKWIVENVIPYYIPLIKPQIVSRHCIWSNFIVSKINLPTSNIEHQETQPKYGFDLSHVDVMDKRALLRNLVNPELGLHILEAAFRKQQKTIEAFQ